MDIVSILPRLRLEAGEGSLNFVKSAHVCSLLCCRSSDCKHRLHHWQSQKCVSICPWKWWGAIGNSILNSSIFGFFEKLINSEIWKILRLMNSFLGANSRINLICFWFPLEKARILFARALGARVHTVIVRSSSDHEFYTLCTSL